MTLSTNTSNTFELSQDQQAIIDELSNTSEGNIAVNAVAGSGKSTTLKLIANQLLLLGYEPREIKIIVFGKQNSIDLIDKFGEHWKNSISTLHGMGYQILARSLGKISRVDGNKYKKIAKEQGYIGTPKYPGILIQKKAIGNEKQFVDLLKFARLNLAPIDVDSLKEIADHYKLDEIFDFARCVTAIEDILQIGLQYVLDYGIISYTDMICVPIYPNWNEPLGIEPSTLVLVDECQDLNPAQRELALKLGGENGRFIFVGDSKQAIFGFAGASCDSFQQIKKEIEAVEFPLSVCYRCPKSHIELVNRIFPTIPIEPCENAVDGILEQLEDESVIHLKDDLILSRKTAPLIGYCLHLIAQGLPAKVRGRDIGQALEKEIDNIWKHAIKAYPSKPNTELFLVYLEDYQNFKEYQWRDLEYGEQLSLALDDKLSCVEVIYNSLGKDCSIKSLKEAVRKIFTESEGYINLSTVHRAKGLEANRVFILEPDDMPLTWSTQLDWEYEQERNLLYVALTRSKSDLYLLGESKWYYNAIGMSDSDIISNTIG